MEIRSTIAGSDPASPQDLHLPIPPAIRQRLGLQPGQSVQWDLDSHGQIRLRCVANPPTPPQKGARHC